MERFERIVVGYHGCTQKFARDLLFGRLPVSQWRPSENRWDWLGHGIYFWEHAPTRALRWARERFPKSPVVIGAVIQLGRCFDLLDESVTSILADSYLELSQTFADAGVSLPQNCGTGRKRRDLDCLVVNSCLRDLHEQGLEYDTVRGAFLEGEPAYPGAGFTRESHIQVVVRNPTCILGVFQPNLKT